MSELQVIFLGFIQGITEFLPISSSGHLLIAKEWLNLDFHSISFDIALHLGSLLAIVIYFYKDITFMFKDFFNILLFKKVKSKLFTQVVIATIPVVIFGVILKITNLESSVRIIPIIAFNLIFFGIFLYFADKKSVSNTSLYEISYKKSLMIGIFQCLALIPGVSRSGICLTGSRIAGVDKLSAVKFSMLISIPSVLGAGLLTFISMDTNEFMPQEFLLGFVVSFFVGIFVIKFLLDFIKKFSFKIFMIYRIILGFLLLIWYFI